MDWNSDNDLYGELYDVGFGGKLCNIWIYVMLIYSRLLFCVGLSLWMF